MFPIVVPWYPLVILLLYYLVGISERYVLFRILLKNTHQKRENTHQ